MEHDNDDDVQTLVIVFNWYKSLKNVILTTYNVLSQKTIKKRYLNDI